MWRVLAPLLAALLLSGCNAHITLAHHQLSQLNRGMDPAEVRRKVEKEPAMSIPASVDGRAFIFDRYLLSSGVDVNMYYLAYEQGRLVYWGYVSEFRRLTDKELARAIDQVADVPMKPTSR